MAAALLAAAGCTGKRERPRHDADLTQAAAPDAGPSAASGRRPKLQLPPPQEPPPRPEGEPNEPGDFQALSQAANDGQPVDKPGAPPVQRLDAYRLRVGRVLVDRQARKLEIPARVNMKQGILEYYGVSSNGKLHESVLELHAEPSHVHLGLVLLGLEPAVWHTPEYQEGQPWQPPTLTRPGGMMSLHVEWSDSQGGGTQRTNAEQWLYNRKSKGAPKPMRWMFQGSQFWNGRYSADLDRSVIALIPDMNAVITTTSDEGNPYRGENLGFEVHEKVIPPENTEVTLVIQAEAQAKPEVPAEAPAKPQE